MGGNCNSDFIRSDALMQARKGFHLFPWRSPERAGFMRRKGENRALGRLRGALEIVDAWRKEQYNENEREL